MVFRAAGASRALVSARFNRFYEKSKAGDIVSNVAGLLDIATGSVESGLEFQAYALSDGVTAYDGLRQLPNGVALTFTPMWRISWCLPNMPGADAPLSIRGQHPFAAR